MRAILHGTVRAVIATTNPWPALLLGIAVVVAVCLWLLFRPGSIADRARHDQELLDGLDRDLNDDDSTDRTTQSDGGT